MKKLICTFIIIFVSLSIIFLLGKGKNENISMQEVLQASTLKDSCINNYEVIDEKEKTVAITKINVTGKKLVIPSQINGYTVICIGKDTNVEGSLKTVGNKNKVTEVVLPNTLQTIGATSFYGYENLEKINIPESVVRIKFHAFCDTALKEVHFWNEKIELESSVFVGCMNLKKVIWPQKQMTGSIESNCFAWTGLETLNYPNVKDPRQLGTRCFAGNKILKQVFFPANNKKLFVLDNTFTECKQVELIVPKEVKEVEYRPSPYVNTMIFQGKDTKLIKLEPLMKKNKKVKGKSYLQLRKVIAPQGSKVLKQVEKCCYGIEDKVSGEDLYDGEDCSYNDGNMKPVKAKAVTLPSAPLVSCKNKTLSWKACSDANKYEVYYANAKNGTYQKVTTTKSLKVSKLKKGFYKICSVKKKYEVDWRSNYSNVVKVK